MPCAGWAQRPPISIHALREEGDRSIRSTSPATTNFYPRPPRGGRLTPTLGFAT